ncbi:MAG: hypothetical protein BGO05_16690 [Rhizobiales bacterium 63-7]|nr:hypothetical protein [Hyphomicrobiales bacterium]OJU69051.1 MAG: hypothetical protein BGO05_16690 [Rhizobiales bacterium 63-7]
MAGYGTNQGFRDYALLAGHVVSDDTTEEKITAARNRGALAIDRFEPRLSGHRTGGFAQERAWPRTGAVTQWGEPIGDNEIPAAIVSASYEASWLELTNPGSLSPVIVGSEQVKREKVGPLEIEYAASASVADLVALATPVVTAIETMLWPFLMPRMPGIMVV